MVLCALRRNPFAEVSVNSTDRTLSRWVGLADHFPAGYQLTEILEANKKLPVLNRTIERIHAPKRRAAHACAIGQEGSSMTWAYKLSVLFFPRHSTTQVGTDG